MAKFEVPRKLISQLEFLENLEYLYRKCCWRARPCSPATFSIQIFLDFLKLVKTIIKSHSLMP